MRPLSVSSQQAHSEFGTNPDFTLDRNRPAVTCHQRVANGQAQPGATLSLGSKEGVKDMLDIFFPDAATGIFHPYQRTPRTIFLPITAYNR